MKKQVKAMVYIPTETLLEIEFPFYTKTVDKRCTCIMRTDEDCTSYTIEKYNDQEDDYYNFELTITKEDKFLQITQSKEGNDGLNAALGRDKYASSKAEFDALIDEMIAELGRVKG